MRLLGAPHPPPPGTKGPGAGREGVPPPRQDTDPRSPGRLRGLSGDQRGVQGEDADERERYRVHYTFNTSAPGAGSSSQALTVIESIA